MRAPHSLLFLLVLPALGCGGGRDGPPPQTDAGDLIQHVREFDDRKDNAKSFAAAFAQGAAPAEPQRRRFAKFSFVPVIAVKPTVQGDTATVKVQVRDGATEKPVGDVDWTYVKEGGQWKLKAAPLP